MNESSFAGVVPIAVGIAVAGGIGGPMLAVVGLGPFVAGVFDRCFFAPLFGLPLSGRGLRKTLESFILLDQRRVLP